MQEALELLRRAQYTDDPLALDRAIDLLRAGLASHIGEPVQAAYLSNLGGALRIRFERTGEAMDLDAAIAASREAVGLTPNDHRGRPALLCNLGASLAVRYEQTDDLLDLDEAIAVHRAATYATPSDHPDRATYLSNLGLSLRMRFERLGDLTDLDAAINACREAVDATDPADPNRCTMLMNLGTALAIRFECTGNLTDLDEAILVSRKAGEATSENHPDRAMAQSNLGLALRDRYERTGDLTDLDDAISLASQALDNTPDDHPSRTNRLANLGLALLARYERNGDIDDVNAAVTVGRLAVERTSDGQPDRARYRANLGASLGVRFEHLGELADLDAAIEVGHQAVQASPSDHPDTASHLSNVAASLAQRFTRTADGADLDRAITIGRQAVTRTPLTHPSRAKYLSNLAAGLHMRFSHAGDRSDLDEAVRGWTWASQSVAATPSERIRAAHEWADAIAIDAGPAAAVEIYAVALALVPLVAGRDAGHHDQQYLLRRNVGSLARDAAASAIAADRTELAVEWLEQGRGVFWSQLLDTRTDLTDLRQTAPGLADELEALLDQLNAAGASRRDAANRIDVLLEQIRALPVSEYLPHPDRFFRQPAIDTLLPAKGDGTVVMVNVSRWRCDALMLTHQGVRSMPLPVSEDEIIDRANDYLAAIQTIDEGVNSGQSTLAATLHWLWDVIAAPVLKALGHVDTPLEDWPRLWWCPTGALTSLPLHAAGYHHTTDTVYDRVVASYVPTARSLAHSRHRRAMRYARQILVIALPETPGHSPIPAAISEHHMLSELFHPQELTLLANAHATHAAIAQSLSGHRIVHVACHTLQHLQDPSRGGLIPYDWRTAGLVTVPDLTEPSHTGGELAFLSSCKTATGGVANPDEVITVSAAMQHAGWSQVIATTWSVPDRAAYSVARAVYAAVLQDGAIELDGVAKALHRAVRHRRDSQPDRPSFWAPFVHLGG